MDGKNLTWLSSILAVALLLAVAAGAAIYAQSGGEYNLSWWTVDGGGEKVEGGGITLVGTVGQSDAGPALGGVAPTGRAYTLVGGFWPGVGATPYRVYLPLVMDD